MKKTIIRPLPGYCLIEPIEDDEKTAGGLYLPESSKDKPCKGKIVNISPVGYSPSDSLITTAGKLAQNTNPTKMLFEEYEKLNVGKIVIYKKWTNQEVDHEGKKYLLVAFSELLAIIE